MEDLDLEYFHQIGLLSDDRMKIRAIFIKRLEAAAEAEEAAEAKVREAAKAAKADVETERASEASQEASVVIEGTAEATK